MRKLMERYFGSILNNNKLRVRLTTRNKFYDVIGSCINARPVLTQSYKEIDRIYKKKQKCVYTSYGISSELYEKYVYKHHISTLFNRDSDKFKEFKFFPYVSCMTSATYNFTPHKSGLWIPRIKSPTCKIPEHMNLIHHDLCRGYGGMYKTESDLYKRNRNIFNNNCANTLYIPTKFYTVRISYNKWSYLPVKDLISATISYTAETFYEMPPLFESLKDARCYLHCNRIYILIIIDDANAINSEIMSDLSMISDSNNVAVIIDRHKDSNISPKSGLIY